MVRSKEIVDPRATSAQSGVSQVPLGISKATDAEMLEQLAANARADKTCPKCVTAVDVLVVREVFELRDMYNRLVNEIKVLARKADVWNELEPSCEELLIKEIQRMASIYDVWE